MDIKTKPWARLWKEGDSNREKEYHEFMSMVGRLAEEEEARQAITVDSLKKAMQGEPCKAMGVDRVGPNDIRSLPEERLASTGRLTQPGRTELTMAVAIATQHN